LKAKRVAAGNDPALQKKHCVFAQLQHEMRGWSGAALRRGHVAKGHGGQKRAFKVKLVGEGVNDYSGPYREVFTDAMREIQEADALEVLVPSPNALNGVGEHRELYVFAAKDARDVPANSVTPRERALFRRFKTAVATHDEGARDMEERLVFLGKLVGTACRHGIALDLPLPLDLVWRNVAEEPLDEKAALREVDALALDRVLHTAQDVDAEIRACDFVVNARRMLDHFVEGLAGVVPAEILPIFSGEELRGIVCGNPHVDVDLLRRVVEYEGYEGHEPVVQYFWETLREMTDRERKLFLQFVWARSRLPLKESDFEAPFKIQKDPKTSSDDTADALPSASTCFFSLSLPEYADKQTLKRKLLYAIENVCTMESDYVTNDAEVGEGWRGL